jgi:AraC family transcriptional regulator, ethanolamine operon transcriptional activator
VFGVTLYRFRKLERLNKARDALLAARPHDTVTRVAMDWGFSEMSRFASDYRAVFDEVPSDTLRRGRQG